MTSKPKLTISAVIGAYQAERYIAETLESILSQTRPPDEVIVVDDGSTDGTARELERFGDRIRVVRQANRGCAAAFNTAFREARGDFVGECGADDIWEPNKLEQQVEALETHPEIDIAFCAARVFGHMEGQWSMADSGDPSVGIMDPHRFGRTLFRVNPVCPSTTLVRRRLYEQLGAFSEEFATEDYDYWMRAQRAGATFYYDPRMLVRYRRHERNASSNHLAMGETDLIVRRRDAELIDSPVLVRKVLARDFFIVGRLLRDQGRVREARAAFVSSLRQRPSLRGLAWVLILSAPPRYHRTLGDRVVSIKRALHSGALP
jgi:glycosyltransferase involved in cell wall biosynthesis